MTIQYLENRNNRAELLEKVSLAQEKENLQFFLSEILDEIRETLQAERVIIERQGIIVAESLLFGWSSLRGTKIKPYQTAHQLFNFSQKGKIISNTNFLSSRLLKSYQIQSDLIIPIFLNQKIFGLIIVHYCSDCENVSETELNYLRNITKEIELALAKNNYLSSQKNLLSRILNPVSKLLPTVG